jgi:hypothetical protein
MPLLGNAAMILSFDIEPASIQEHDEWHTREHMPERLAIPGFNRGSRWIAATCSPRYFVMYEVADIGVLSSANYLERLDHPTPWTAKMMKSYRGMTRGLCIPVAQIGSGLGNAAARHEICRSILGSRRVCDTMYCRAISVILSALKIGNASPNSLKSA